MNRPPAFQFYPKDWLDFRVQRMSLAAQGAYLKLLCFMWKDSHDQCSIIDNDRAIATAIGVPCDSWKELRAEIQFPGDPILQEEGQDLPVLRSKRLQQEAEKQQNYARQQAEKGKRGAQKRWQRDDSRGHSSGHAPAIAEGMTENSSSSSLNQLDKAERSNQRRKKSAAVPLPQEFTISDSLWEWATKKHYTREWIEREFEKFCNHHRAEGSKYIDWDSAFRKWVLKAEDFALMRNGQRTRLVNGHSQNIRERIPL